MASKKLLGKLTRIGPSFIPGSIVTFVVVENKCVVLSIIVAHIDLFAFESDSLEFANFRVSKRVENNPIKQSLYL